MTWQPIETAPKDGTHVILWIEGSAIEGQWDSQTRNDGTSYGPGTWEVLILPSHGCGCCSNENDPPTHWMPLPTPPVPA